MEKWEGICNGFEPLSLKRETIEELDAKKTVENRSWVSMSQIGLNTTNLEKKDLITFYSLISE